MDLMPVGTTEGEWNTEGEGKKPMKDGHSQISLNNHIQKLLILAWWDKAN